MAGRGVDIKLGGNAEHLTQLELRKRGLEPDTDEWDKAWDEVFPAIEEQVEAEDREKVLEAGGLFILGTERHESRRIDNQLRGRSGRQGDPGESRFYLSAEDDLVRLFAGDRIYRILDRLGPVDKETGEEEPIEAKMLSKQIESAQKKVEEQNFLIRKRVLEYDDVMNQQREIIYEYRDRILEGEDMSDDRARRRSRDVIERMSGEYLRATSRGVGPRRHVHAARADVPGLDRARGPRRERAEREELIDELREDIVKAYDEREEELGEDLMRALERYMLLQIIDERWREHLHDMDYLREGIHLRGFAQIEPLVAYKNEGFEMFTDLMNNIWDEDAHPGEGPRRRHRGRRASLAGGEEAREGGAAGLAPRGADIELSEERTRPSRVAGRRGDAAPEGRDAARERALHRHGALDQPGGGRPGPPGEEAPRQAPGPRREAQNAAHAQEHAA